MKKSDLLKVKIPNQYQDCSDWFEEGVDTIPSLLDFIRCGRKKEEYDMFQQLYAIECMKKHAKETTDDKMSAEAEALIEEAIQRYNAI